MDFNLDSVLIPYQQGSLFRQLEADKTYNLVLS